MILDRLDQADKYLSLNPHFSKALKFLRRGDLAELEPGRHDIDGKDIYAVIVKGNGRPKDQAKLEAHRRYIDIQFIVSGCDEMGWQSTALCKKVEQKFDPDSDAEIFNDPVATWLTVGAGELAVFFPHDAHAPAAGSAEFHKVVVKVALL